MGQSVHGRSSVFLNLSRLLAFHLIALMEGYMKDWKVAAAMIALMVSGTAQAQTAFYWPAPEAQPAGEAKRYYLPMGTPLMLRTRTQVSTKDNKPGDRLYLEVAESVSFRGQIIIPIGAPVFAEVSRVQRNGHFGKKGKLEIRLISAETPSGPVRLSGAAYDEGKSGTAASVATMALLSGLGFLIHGTSAELAPGTPVQAYLAEPLRFTWYPDAGPRGAMEQARSDSFNGPAPGFSISGAPD